MGLYKIFHPSIFQGNLKKRHYFEGWFLKHVTWHFLKDPVISGESVYYLSASKELEGITGKFFNLTTMEKPAWHTLKREKRGKPIWDLSMELAGLDDTTE